MIIVARTVRSLLAVLLLMAGTSAYSFAAPPRNFASPDAAAAALAAAAHADDARALVAILGSGSHKIVYSGDRVADLNGRAQFAVAYDALHKIEPEGADRATLVVGKDEWPFPIPLVRRGATWHFDTKAGAQAILDRRIGRNELNAIQVCRAYVAAQRDYATADRDNDSMREYAQHFVSSPGKHDGLYWPTAPSAPESPMGLLVADARAQGYGPTPKGEKPHRPQPYHGYFYRILTRQGPHAPGGALDYVVDGHMIGGFALVAYPAKWGDSGIMTLIVNQDGIVYQKNFGPRTATLARAITEYDPDPSWTKQQP
ncbi:MAG: DUF2950 domain-containing protein [Stellaceae bacterium]